MFHIRKYYQYAVISLFEVVLLLDVYFDNKNPFDRCDQLVQIGIYAVRLSNLLMLCSYLSAIKTTRKSIGPLFGSKLLISENFRLRFEIATDTGREQVIFSYRRAWCHFNVLRLFRSPPNSI